MPKVVPDVIVYLDVTPLKCLERIKSRGREFEVNVDLEYLETLDKHYKEYLKSCEDDGIKVFKLSSEDISIQDLGRQVLDMLISKK